MILILSLYPLNALPGSAGGKRKRVLVLALYIKIQFILYELSEGRVLE